MQPALTRVGAWLAAVQLLFALGWTVYATYLPQLLQQAGLPRAWAPWVLLLDQLVFLASDLAMGLACDRMVRVLGRLGRWVLGLTLASALAFLLLPWAAPAGHPMLLLALTLVWAVGSSALRAPPLTLIGRHVARPQQPALVALHVLGLGLAGALAPFAGAALAGVDPRLPFALSAVVLAAATLGVLGAERALAAAAPKATPAPTPPGTRAATPWLAAVLAAALAFQLHVFVNSAALHRQVAPATDLAALAAVFWVGFNMALWPASQAAKRWGALRVMAPAALLAALAAGAAAWAAPAGLRMAVVAAQYLAGAAWALLLAAAFAGALALGRGGREGWMSGALNAALAAAALLRLAVVGLQWPQLPQWAAWLPLLPVAGWLLAAPLLRRAGRRGTTMPA